MEQTHRSYLLPVVVLVVLHTVATAALMAPPVFAVAAAAQLHVDVVWIGLYPALVYTAAIGSSILAGGMAAAVGPIRTSQYCLCFIGAGSCLLASGNLVVMALASLIIGIGYGPLTPAGSDLLKHVTPFRLQPIVFSVKQTAVPAGGALAGAVAPVLVYAVGWNKTTLVMGGACIGLAALAELLRPPLDGRSPRSRATSVLGLQSLRLLWEHGNFAALGVAGLTFAVVQGVLFTYLVPYLSEGLGMSLVLAGAVLTAAQIGGIVGRIVWGFVATWRNGGTGVLFGLSVAMAASAAVTGLFDTSWSIIAIMSVSVAFGMTAIGWNGVFLAEIALAAPQGTIGAITGALAALAYLGVMIGPPIFGILSKATHGYSFGFFAVAGAALIGGAVLFRGQRATRRECDRG